MPTPVSTSAEVSRRNKAGGSSQKLRLLRRGKDMSGAPNIRGSSQFPKPPMAIGITKKKIIINAWAVTMTLYSWSEPSNGPGWASSKRIRRLKASPIIADQVAKIK